jgi:hypothetical protein
MAKMITIAPRAVYRTISIHDAIGAVKSRDVHGRPGPMQLKLPMSLHCNALIGTHKVRPEHIANDSGWQLDLTTVEPHIDHVASAVD